MYTKHITGKTFQHGYNSGTTICINVRGNRLIMECDSDWKRLSFGSEPLPGASGRDCNPNTS